MKFFLISIFISTCLLNAMSQDDTLPIFSQEEQRVGDTNVPDMDFRGSIYRTHKVWTPVTVAVGTVLNYSGLATLAKEEVTLEELNSITSSQVIGIDRVALRQAVDQRFDAGSVSDVIASIALFSPILLNLDAKIRKDWLEVSLISLEGILLGANFFAWGPTRFVDRLRPIVYYDELDFEERAYKFNRNSFFSGHVAWAASAAYTSATIYADYHPQVNKWLIYGLASLPPAAVGYYRYRALKHYPSDIIVGHLVGLAAGIFVPRWHRKGKSNQNLTVAISGGGIGLRYRQSL